MASPPPLDEAVEEKSAVEKAAVEKAAAGASASRENFLRRLEQQQQQKPQQEPEEKEKEPEQQTTQQLKSPPEEEADDDVPGKTMVANNKTVGSDISVASDAAVTSVPEPASANIPKDCCATRGACTTPPTKRKSNNNVATPKKKLTAGDQLLANYLSKYCDGPSNVGSPACCAASSKMSPADWIGDIEPSSLAFLRGLAGIPDDTRPKTAPAPIPNRGAIPNDGFNSTVPKSKLQPAAPLGAAESLLSSFFSAKPPPTKNPTGPRKMWAVHIPPHAVPGKSFDLRANGARVRVTCPADSKPGDRVHFYLPESLFEMKKVPLEPPLPQAESFIEGTANAPPLPPLPPSYEDSTDDNLSAEHREWMKENQFQVPSEEETKPAAAKRPAEKENLESVVKDILSEGDKKPAAKDLKPSSNSRSNDQLTLQERMLTIIESQQTQMSEMQARLDALGGTMARMEQDVRYLRHNGPPPPGAANFDPYGYGAMGMHPAQRRAAPARGYRILGGFFGGNGGGPPPGGPGGFPPGAYPNMPGMQPGVYRQAPPGYGPGGLPPWQGMPPPGQPGPVPPAAAAQPPRPPEAELEDQPPPLERLRRGKRRPPAQPNQPAAPPPGVRPWQAPPPPAVPAQGAAPPRHDQVIIMHQGVFFPLFVALFRFVLSLPSRARSILLHTGPGRAYAHLRDRAVERNAFANVDLSSIMKLLVMLLIFTGRVGEGERRNQRNGRADAEVDGLAAYARSLLRSMYDYWNGHRVHTLILASLVGFLVQVGLMGFLYEVLWVEREELGRAWMGRDEPPAAEEGAGGGAEGGGDGPNAGAVGPANADNRGEGAVAEPPGPPPAIGGLIRRGPENGGFFHDVQCLVMSFLLSLIPAWRPEEAAEPLPEPAPQEDAQGQQDGGQPGEEVPPLERDASNDTEDRQQEPAPVGGDGGAD